MANGTGPVARILYKELLVGDLRKLQASANDADSGGGARDFRFRSFDRLLPVIQHMFPETVIENRMRDGKRVQIEIFRGTLNWVGSHGNTVSKEVLMEPPTTARPGEGRISRIYQYDCFSAKHLNVQSGNRVLLLFIQLDDGTVWPYYAEERSLRTPGAWHHIVAQELLNCIDAKRPASQAVLGFRDFTNHSGFCNGK